MSEVTEDFLAHYGVKGMHWGKHKSSDSKTVEVSRQKKAPIDKAKLKEARKDIYSDVKAHMGTPGQRVTTGAALASTLIGGPSGSAIIGAQMMRGAGFSKKKAFTTALLGGAPGAMLMIELQARKNARE